MRCRVFLEPVAPASCPAGTVAFRALPAGLEDAGKDAGATERKGYFGMIARKPMTLSPRTKNQESPCRKTSPS